MDNWLCHQVPGGVCPLSPVHGIANICKVRIDIEATCSPWMPSCQVPGSQLSLEVCTKTTKEPIALKFNLVHLHTTQIPPRFWHICTIILLAKLVLYHQLMPASGHLQGQLIAWQGGFQGPQMAAMSIQNPTDISEAMDRDNHKRSHVPCSILELDDTDSTVVHVSGWHHGVFWVGVFLFSWRCIWVMFLKFLTVVSAVSPVGLNFPPLLTLCYLMTESRGQSVPTAL